MALGTIWVTVVPSSRIETHSQLLCLLQELTKATMASNKNMLVKCFMNYKYKDILIYVPIQAYSVDIGSDLSGEIRINDRAITNQTLYLSCHT